MGEYDTSEYPWLIKRGHATGELMAETIVTQELAIRAAIPSSVPGTGSIPAANTLLVKDSSASVPTYEPLAIDATLSISLVGSVLTLSESGIIPGSNGTLRMISPDGGASIQIQALVTGSWVYTGLSWQISNIPVPPTGFGLQQQLTTNWGVRDNGAGNLIFQKLIGGVWTDTPNVIS